MPEVIPNTRQLLLSLLVVVVVIGVSATRSSPTIKRNCPAMIPQRMGRAKQRTDVER